MELRLVLHKVLQGRVVFMVAMPLPQQFQVDPQPHQW
jgi:hypothetical protein